MSPTGSRSAELIEENRGLVRRIAADTRRRFRLSIELEELEAAGFEGLLEAEAAYDADRGVAFTTFAYYRIRGAILDNCRRLGLVRRQYRKVATFEAAANEVLEVAASSAPQGGSWITGAFDALAVAFQLSEVKRAASSSPEARVEKAELTDRMRRHLASISDEERRVVKDYYFRRRRMQEIAEELGVSKSWVSRVHSRALKKLRPLVLGTQRERGKGEGG